MASGSEDNTVRLWNIETETPKHTCQGHSNWVLCIAWSPDGRMLASGGRDEKVTLINASSGEVVREFPHSDEVFACAISPDGTLLASGGSDYKVTIRDLRSGEVKAELA